MLTNNERSIPHLTPLALGGHGEDDQSSDLGRLRALVSRQALQIREIDHRAKNSLQLAASMLTLQARRGPDKKAARELMCAVDRLQALAEIHRATYEADALDEIPIQSWIGNLCRSLVFHAGIRLEISCPNHNWPFSIAGPAGLFIGEALTNACKHGFPDLQGLIEIDVVETATRCYTITVQDDGVGLAPEATNGLGVELLAIFAQQIGGELVQKPGPGSRGCCVSVAFSVPG